MADTNIQEAFIEGVNEIYSTLFTDGINDGVYFYPIYEPPKKNVYGEVKYKQYLPPVLLVAKVVLLPQQGEEDIKALKEKATMTIPFKSLRDNNIDVSNKNLFELRKGLLKYKDTFYEIDNIKPSVFVADTFITYIFECTEDLNTTEIQIYGEVEDNEGDVIE